MANSCILRGKQEQVLENWITISKKRFPAASDKSRAAIRDHLPELMKLLCVVIETKSFESPVQQSQTHGRQRHAVGDYTLLELIGEYSILKNLVFDELPSEEANDFELLRLVDLFFDSAISVAATEFAKLREEELIQSANRLQESNLDLERFSGIAAHDLRSPAATIVGFADVLVDLCLNEPLKLKPAATIQRTARRMIDLIDQLLMYAKLGKSDRAFDNVSLTDAANEAIDNLDSAIQVSQSKVTLDNLPTLLGDSTLLSQLFQNLIANSLKFKSPDRPCEILISGSTSEGEVKIRVSDNGLGFNPALNEIIFLPFARAHEHLPIQGSGIGLATVERIVKLHGGSITAYGVEGVGATFIMTF